MVKFCFLNNILGLLIDKEIFLACFGSFFGPKLTIFAQKIRFSAIFFFQNHASEFHVTRPETVDNDYKSFNGSFVSGKIILVILALFLSCFRTLFHSRIGHFD